jgi:hypothetical protein
LADHVESLAEKFQSHRTNSITPAITSRLLVGRDLQRIPHVLRTVKFEPVWQELESSAAELRIVIRSLGIDANFPPVKVVEHLPRPYHGMGWEALCIDAEDFRRYGLEPGIYFNKSKLRPRLSAVQLAHEVVHYLVAQHGAELLARGLEEGLCEILGSLYFASKVFGSDLVARVFRINHFAAESDRLWELYLEYTRQAAYLYRRFGLAGLLQVVQSGRGTIKVIETKCLRGDLEMIELRTGDWDAELSRLLDSLASVYIRSLIVSPLARYVADFVEESMNVESVAHRARLSPSSVLRAMRELQSKTFSIVLNGGNVDYCDLPILVNSNSLRYSLAAKQS